MSSKRFGLSHSSLQLIAMACMLCDHTCTVLLSQYKWMKCVGRLAFPIYCFLLVEGFYHTHNCTKYIMRLAVFGLLSELPFNLAFSGGGTSYIYQNVMWTLLIGLLCVAALDKLREIDDINIIVKYFLMICIVYTGFMLGENLRTDYGGKGVLQILVFYLLHNIGIWGYLLQAVCLYYINAVMLGGNLIYLFGHILHIQTLALCALPIIWFYNGKKGITNKYYKWGAYVFYPVHLLVLHIIRSSL